MVLASPFLQEPSPRPDGARVMERLNLFHKFLVILFLSTLVGVVTLAGTISYLVKRNFVEEEARDTASLVRALSRTTLSPQVFAQAESEKDGAVFSQFASRLISLPEVIRVKIYNAVGTVVWSDEERLIGEDFRDNRELGEALKGNVRVEMGLLKAEHLYEREGHDERRLLEVYVPLIRTGSKGVYGVLEIYKHPVSHFALIDTMRIAVWALSLTLGIILFLSCSWLFWNALKEQRRLDTEKRQAETQLIQAEKLAMVGEMFAGLAHEINNPLSIMMSKVRLILKDLQGTDPRPELVQDLRVIDRNISRIGAIVRSLLAFTRKSNADLVPLNLNAVIREALMLVEKPFAKMDIYFEQSLDSALPEIFGEANQLQQVFLNLWSNARDAMKQGGRIRVRTYSVNHDRVWVAAEVSDSGKGIAPETIGKVFDPFFTTKGTHEGAGLGLAVSYGIVKSHGGTIQAESQPGQGATFTLKFPAPVST